MSGRPCSSAVTNGADSAPATATAKRNSLSSLRRQRGDREGDEIDHGERDPRRDDVQPRPRPPRDDRGHARARARAARCRTVARPCGGTAIPPQRRRRSSRRRRRLAPRARAVRAGLPRRPACRRRGGSRTRPPGASRIGRPTTRPHRRSGAERRSPGGCAAGRARARTVVEREIPSGRGALAAGVPTTRVSGPPMRGAARSVRTRPRSSVSSPRSASSSASSAASRASSLPERGVPPSPPAFVIGEVSPRARRARAHYGRSARTSRARLRALGAARRRRDLARLHQLLELAEILADLPVGLLVR